jgi:hypothetical protein
MLLKKLSLLILLTAFFTPSQGETIKVPETENEYNFYVGTFDTIDKEGDDKTSLFGLEHENTNLFRDTKYGKFSPVTGGFISGDNSV